jgi:hypothetical protein
VSGSDGRQTKAQRKEEARLLREELQRKAAARRRTRTIGVIVVLALLAAGAAFALTRPKPSIQEPSKLLAMAGGEAKAAGCGQVTDVGAYQPESLDRAHIGTGQVDSMPPLSSYPSIPPASGPHSQQTWPAGVYDTAPAMDQLIHSLEHGAAVVWYDPSASGPELKKITTFFSDPAVSASVIVAPYDYPDQGEAGKLPGGVEMALVSWHHLETCARPNLAAAFDFTARYGAPPFDGEKYIGTAPEAGATF